MDTSLLIYNNSDNRFTSLNNAARPAALTDLPPNFVPFARQWLDRSLPERFEHQVEQSSEWSALKTAEQLLTYDQLNRAANAVAHAIVERCGIEPEPIAVLIQDDVKSVIVLLGILKAGKFFVNLNPAMPPAGLIRDITSIEPKLLLTDCHLVSLATVVTKEMSNGCNILLVEDLRTDRYPATNLTLAIAPNAYAQIVSTSGSTGKPKNVLITHETLLHQSMIHINGYYISSDDRVMATTPLTFGSSLSDVFAALLGGATLYPFAMKTQTLTQLIRWLKQEEITIYHSVSTLYRRMIQALTDVDSFPHLRVIKLGGETVHRYDLEQYKKYFADPCILRVGLASTEANLISWYFVGKETETNTLTVPVGYALTDKEIFLLDEKGKQVELGAVGEIVVRSRFLSPGYWRDTALTAAKFLPDPEGGNKRIYHTGDLGRFRPDGMLEHLGRKDQMIKIRGYRVELEAIEGALMALPLVCAATVIATKDTESNQSLVAYVVPHVRAITGSKLRNALQATLPDYMLPSQFVILDALPLLPSGKVDRDALPKPDSNGYWQRPPQDIPYQPSRTPIEDTLVAIWQEVLGIEQVGIDDHFLDLGGNSLRAMQVHSRLVRQVQSDLPARLLFECATIAEMSLLITQQQAAQVDPAALAQFLTVLEETPDAETKNYRSTPDVFSK